jgi:mannose/cellobiose epimerase-like protein (N-acyl-D-glucosamine 2-epimerase family)
MHSVEAYLAAGDVIGNPVWPAQAASIARRLIDHHARAHREMNLIPRISSRGGEPFVSA